MNCAREISAFVVVAAGSTITAAAVAEHRQKRLASLKVPEEVMFVANVLHSSAGKILEANLKEMLSRAGRLPQERRPVGQGSPPAGSAEGWSRKQQAKTTVLR